MMVVHILAQLIADGESWNVIILSGIWKPCFVKYIDARSGSSCIGINRFAMGNVACNNVVRKMVY